jgi:molybdopterin biosynthesis enzyme MoaB
MSSGSLAAKVLTVSDGVFHGARIDTGGEGVAGHLERAGYVVIERSVIQDGRDEVATELLRLSDDGRNGFRPP